MAVQDAVLWMTERGLGTCWLAGVNQRELVKAASLGDGRSVPVIISIGRPALDAPRTVSYGGISYKMMSRRRKPISRIACLENAGSPYPVTDIAPVRFEADSSGIEGLLKSIRDGHGPMVSRASAELALDACLEGARVAPSGNNAQDWLFIVLRDGKRLSRLAGLCGMEVADPPKMAIVAAGHAWKFEKLMLDRPFWDIDVPIAMSNISLVATSAGYTVDARTGGIDEAGIRGLVNLPSAMRVVGVTGLT
jgi:nitroreductase